MSKISQGEAVFQATVAVLGSIQGRVLDTISEAQTKQVHEVVFQMFKEGTTTHSRNPSDEELRKYIPGLVNNWMRKDLRLNGGTKYEAKNPGSRAGSGDAALKNMKLLLETVSEPVARAAIQKEIDQRKEQLSAAKRPAINVDALPEHLRYLVG